MQHEREQVQSMRPTKKMKTAPASDATPGATAEFGFWGGITQEMASDGPSLPNFIVPSVSVTQIRQ